MNRKMIAEEGHEGGAVLPLPRAITIVGAPVEAGAGIPGAAMGPAMLRTAGIVKTLRDLGHDRRSPRAGDRMGFAGKQPRPTCDLGEPMGLAFRRARVGQGRQKSEIAPILDVVAEVAQRLNNACCAQHGRSHRRARNVRPRLDRGAENSNGPRKRQKRPAQTVFASCLPGQERPLPQKRNRSTLVDSGAQAPAKT